MFSFVTSYRSKMRQHQQSTCSGDDKLENTNDIVIQTEYSNSH